MQILYVLTAAATVALHHGTCSVSNYEIISSESFSQRLELHLCGAGDYVSGACSLHIRVSLKKVQMQTFTVKLLTLSVLQESACRTSQDGELTCHKLT